MELLAAARRVSAFPFPFPGREVLLAVLDTALPRKPAMAALYAVNGAPLFLDCLIASFVSFTSV